MFRQHDKTLLCLLCTSIFNKLKKIPNVVCKRKLDYKYYLELTNRRTYTISYCSVPFKKHWINLSNKTLPTPIYYTGRSNRLVLRRVEITSRYLWGSEIAYMFPKTFWVMSLDLQTYKLKHSLPWIRYGRRGGGRSCSHCHLFVIV